MSFAGEARPYMPLAAAAVGMLAYYLAPAAMRGRPWVEMGGWIAVLLGASMHPYFGLYWLAVFIFAHGLVLLEGDVKPTLKLLLWHVNLPLSLVGTAVFLWIGSLSWLRGGPAFKFDPFAWLGPRQVLENIVLFHTEFSGEHTLANGLLRLAWMGVAGVLVLMGFVLPRRLKSPLQSLFAPAVLFWLSIGLTVVLCWLSYRRNYWILARQWVASIALATVASIWLWGELARLLARWRSWVGAAMVALPLCFLVIAAMDAGGEKLKSFQNDFAAQSAQPSVDEPKPNAPLSDNSPETWVRMANQNIRQGGPVWAYFRHYYAEESNIKPVFKDREKAKTN
jgi:hypothetical protein